jgi:hypothetical protein
MRIRINNDELIIVTKRISESGEIQSLCVLPDGFVVRRGYVTIDDSVEQRRTHLTNMKEEVIQIYNNRIDSNK